MSSNWKRIAASPLWNAYVRESYWLARSVEENLSSAFADASLLLRSNRNRVGSDFNILSRIILALQSSARLRALIRHAETPKTLVQNERAGALRELLAGVQLAPILDASVRNSLEHFDEYMDRLAVQYESSMITLPSIVSFDLIAQERDALSQLTVGSDHPTIKHMRTFIVDERIFIMKDREVSLGPIRDACSSVRERLDAQLPDVVRNDRMGVLAVMTKATFESKTPDETN